jgi:hypothetical protein
LASLFWGTFFFLILFFSIFFFFFSYRSSSTSYFRKKKASRNRVPPPPPPSSLPTVSSCRRPYLIWPALGYLSLCVYTLSKTLLSRLLDIFFFFKTIPNPPAAFATQQTILKTFHPKFWGPSSLSMDDPLFLLIFIPYRTSVCVSSILFFFFFFSCSSYT